MTVATPTLTSVGDLIAYYRTERNMSKRKLARLLGIYHQTLGRYESGEIAVSTTRIAAIARQLNVPFQALIPLHMQEQKIATEEAQHG